jgi:hypothetical protein
MFNKHTTALYTAVIVSVLVASMFTISYVQQQALAQGNQTSGGGSNQTGGGNQTAGKMTSVGPVTGGAATGGGSSK